MCLSETMCEKHFSRHIIIHITKNVPQSPCMTCACQKQCAKNISADPHHEKCSPVTIRGLWPRTVSFAHLFDPQGKLIMKLIESMPRRVAAVIAARGGHTKY